MKSLNTKVNEKFEVYHPNVSLKEILNNIILVHKYPWLKPRNVFSDKVVKGYNYTYTLLDTMEDGWKKAFGEQWCADIDRALTKGLSRKWKRCTRKKFRILQIKEKFGALRTYFNFYTDELKKVTEKYEKLSRRVCVKCGEKATVASIGWICPWCDDCAKNNIRNNKRKETLNESDIDLFLKEDYVPIEEFYKTWENNNE